MSLDNELAWPQKGNKLFIDGVNKYEFAHFGWEHTETQFWEYREGYKTAGDELINFAIKSKNIKILDTFIFPVCFLYRQYLELVMKYIYLYFSDANKEEKIKTLKDTSHNLYEIWYKIKPLLQEAANERDKEAIEVVEDYINQFSAFDKSSVTFRYPVTKKLDGVLTGVQSINLPNLKDRMNELCNFFEGCIGKLSEIKKFKAEMLREYLSEIENGY